MLCRTLFILLWILVQSATAQDGSSDRSIGTEASGQSRQDSVAEPHPVFPADADVVARKHEILGRIPVVSKGKERPPNIVLIFVDDLGYADTGLYGSDAIPTPNIDSLGRSGVKFTNAYVTAGSCSPSRAGLMTGCYQQRFGFEFNTSGGAITHREHRGLDPKAITIADVLKRAGYTTGMFGKWHLGTQPQFHPQVRGFDEFYGFLAGAHSFLPVKRPEQIFSTIMRGNDPMKEPRYLTDAIARETVNFIGQHADAPFFAYVPFNAVHTPIEATKKYRDRFPTIKNAKRRDYYAMTSALDDAVGAITAALDQHGLAGNTFVIFLNDNGGPLYTGVQSNGPLRLGKLFLFEGGIRVPMVVKWPAMIESGQVFNGVTSSLDVFPTICDAAGIELPKALSLDGVSLLPHLTGKNQESPHAALFWSSGPNQAVRHQNWKLIRSDNSRWLFDLSADIGEKNNVIDANPEKRKFLEDLLDKWKSEMSPPAWPSKPKRREVSIDGQAYEINI